ncbi:MAG TPA: hypothetical protein VIG51_05755 [Candidatus Baltobacteraceae bacterium]|jgi:hypothetical protein
MKPHFFAVIPLTALVLTAGIAVADGPKPIRHLAYHFDVSVISTLTSHSSGIGDGTGGSGLANYSGGQSDKGTITLDVMQAAADGGLTVQVAENALNSRSAKSTLCVVYGDGRMICDPNGKITEEEQALLQAAGRNFVDPTQFDAKKHWRVAGGQNGFTTATDYTMTAGDPTKVVTISLQRVDKMDGAQGYNATTDGFISYNMPLSVPTAIKEDTVMRQSQGMGQDNRVDTHVSMNLLTDSMQVAKP